MTNATAPHGFLVDGLTGEVLRPATAVEQCESEDAAERTAGFGLIVIAGRLVCVEPIFYADGSPVTALSVAS